MNDDFQVNLVPGNLNNTSMIDNLPTFFKLKLKDQLSPVKIHIYMNPMPETWIIYISRKVGDPSEINHQKKLKNKDFF